ncbi:hypothetical protein [uncultured Hymenobacter sp.]|uniref:hypothetical protein n=1 Tax=uncultured Hymenobacter sp. TaxID=170016 RepID=UPI0035CB14B4
MAEIHIQPKKSAPSPWLLVLLVGALLALAAYFYLRPDPADTSTAAAPVPAAPAASAEPSAAATPRELPAATAPASPAPPTPPPAANPADEPAPTPLTPSELAAYAATDAAVPGYARRGLQQLAATLVDLADRADLQDPAVQEQRNNLTSATARLGEDASASLRPGFVAAAGLLRTVQQKAYPDQEASAAQLQQLAGQLSGRANTAAEQQQVRRFLSAAAVLLEPLSRPAAAQ